MKSKPSKVPICQSCSMPMERPEDFGTNAGGSKSRDYCNFCFQNGKFTDAGITVDQMINKVAGMTAQMTKMPENQAKEMSKAFIPKLKRWQGK